MMSNAPNLCLIQRPHIFKWWMRILGADVVHSPWVGFPATHCAPVWAQRILRLLSLTVTNLVLQQMGFEKLCKERSSLVSQSDSRTSLPLEPGFYKASNVGWDLCGFPSAMARKNLQRTAHHTPKPWLCKCAPSSTSPDHHCQSCPCDFQNTHGAAHCHTEALPPWTSISVRKQTKVTKVAVVML